MNRNFNLVLIADVMIKKDWDFIRFKKQKELQCKWLLQEQLSYHDSFL